MAEERRTTRELLRHFDRVAYLGSLLAIVALLVAYFASSFLGPGEARNQSDPESLIKGLATDLIAVFLLFAGSYTALKRIEEIKFDERADELADKIAARVNDDDGVRYFDSFEDVPWKTCFARARRVHICAQYCNAWVVGLSGSFRELFSRGGQVDLVLPAYGRDDVVAMIQRRSPDEPVEKVRAKIQESAEKLAQLCAASAHPDARVRVYFVEQSVLYFGVRFDGAELAMSWYEQIREMGAPCPTIYFDLARKPGMRNWFEKEWTGLATAAVDSRVFAPSPRAHGVSPPGSVASATPRS